MLLLNQKDLKCKLASFYDPSSFLLFKNKIILKFSSDIIAFHHFLMSLLFTGFNSWLLWRSAYLTRLGSWRLRMQVPMDWTKTLLFGRDTSRF